MSVSVAHEGDEIKSLRSPSVDLPRYLKELRFLGLGESLQGESLLLLLSEEEDGEEGME